VSACGLGAVLRIEPGNLNLLGEVDLLQRRDAVIVDINLVPRQPATGRDRVGVVVVVPPLAARQKGDPPIVLRVVSGFKATLTSPSFLASSTPGFARDEQVSTSQPV